MKFFSFYIFRFLVCFVVTIIATPSGIASEIGSVFFYLFIPMLLIDYILLRIWGNKLDRWYEERKPCLLIIVLILCLPDLVYLTLMSEGRIWYYRNAPLVPLILLFGSTVLFFILQKLKIISIPKE